MTQCGILFHSSINTPQNLGDSIYELWMRNVPDSLPQCVCVCESLASETTL